MSIPEPEPTPQHLPASAVIDAMARFGRERVVGLGPTRVLILGVMGGGFITMGALFSVLLGIGVHGGPALLIEGFGFATGFFFVVLSEAVLFTEANVVLPATLLETRLPRIAILRFWGLAWLANLVGAVIVGTIAVVAQRYPAEVEGLLSEIIGRKMAFQADGGVWAWGRIVLSGVLANWLVGMAAFFATMGRTIIGKYIPVLLAVSLFVAANFQHSPANMGYFALAGASGIGPGWPDALWWNIIPAGIGNLIGGSVLVALPFWHVFGRRRLPE